MDASGVLLRGNVPHTLQWIAHPTHIAYSQGSHLILNLRVAADSSAWSDTTGTMSLVARRLEFLVTSDSDSTANGSDSFELSNMNRSDAQPSGDVWRSIPYETSPFISSHDLTTSCLWLVQYLPHMCDRYCYKSHGCSLHGYFTCSLQDSTKSWPLEW